MACLENFVSKDLPLIPLESEFFKYNLTFKEGTSKNCPEFKQQLLGLFQQFLAPLLKWNDKKIELDVR